MRIGVFDSGIGGVTVLEKAMEKLPYEDFIFYADTEHVPYGTKSKEEIEKFLDNVVSFMLEHGVEIIVLACNTATSAAATYLRKKYTNIEILGMEPAVKVVTDSVYRNDQDLIIVSATDLTLKLRKFDELIHRLEVNEQVISLSLQKLVCFAEKRQFDDEEVYEYIQSAINDLELENVCAFVLGCTHFTYYKSLICDILKRKIGKDIPVIDGNEGTVQNLMNKVRKIPNYSFERKREVQFFESGKLIVEDKYKQLLQIAHKENSRRC